MAKKKKFCNLIIIDASGSMFSKKKEVVGQLKKLFKEIKEDTEAKHTTIVCDFSNAGDFREICNTNKSEELSDELAESYKTRGMTALYDAIGLAFKKVKKGFDGVFCSIITDGQENDSKEFTSDQIKRLIEKRQKKGWGIVFSGTTKEAIEQARGVGVHSTNSLRYSDNSEGIAFAGAVGMSARKTYFSRVQISGSMATVDNTNLMVSEEEEG